MLCEGQMALCSSTVAAGLSWILPARPPWRDGKRACGGGGLNQLPLVCSVHGRSPRLLAGKRPKGAAPAPRTATLARRSTHPSAPGRPHPRAPPSLTWYGSETENTLERVGWHTFHLEAQSLEHAVGKGRGEALEVLPLL